MSTFSRLKQRYFRKGFRRSWNRLRARAVGRLHEDDFAEAFARLGIPAGSVLIVHARLSSFGHIVDGPASVIRALRAAVPDSTVVMPTFPFSRTMLEYLDSNSVFDPASTPSRSGLLSEAFRQMPGVLRSAHPTHPCTALGPLAVEIIAGSERSSTPFGRESGYGRAAHRPDCYQVLLDTNSTSLVHVVQEIIGMPNLFLDQPRMARGVGSDRTPLELEVRVHTPKIPLFVAVDGANSAPQYIWMPDYCVPFPASSRDRILADIANVHVRGRITERDNSLYGRGVLRMSRLRSAQILAMHVAPWLGTICDELRDNIGQHPEWYRNVNADHRHYVQGQS